MNFIFDFDSTLVSNESLNDILKLSLDGDIEKINKLEEITKDAMEGKMPFKQSLEERLKLATINKKIVEKIKQETQDKIIDGAIDLIKLLKNKNHNLYIVSGGFFEVIKQTADILGIENIYSNKLIFDNNGDVIGVEDTFLLYPEGKVNAIKFLKKQGKINNDKIIMIGDGYIDLETKLAGVADEFVCFTGAIEREEVIKQSKYVCKNMKELEDCLLSFCE